MLYVFDEFILEGILTEFTSLKWTRKFNTVGNFEVTLPFSIEQMKLLAPGRIVYKKDTDEAAFVFNRNIFTDSSGKENLIIRGLFLSEMLSRRIVNYIKTASPVVAIEEMIIQNMIESSNQNRNIPDLILDLSGISMELQEIKVENEELLKAVTEICDGENLGFRVRFDHQAKKYRIGLYQGRTCTEVIFSKQFGNVVEQDYYEETSTEKNTALVDNNGSVTIVGNDNAGLNRKEIYTSFDSSGGSASYQGQIFLKDYKRLESMDTVIDTLSTQFEYLKDWDLGDIVSCKNSRWGVTIQKNILEIEEFYSESGKKLTVVFGDYIPTIKERK